MTKEDPNQEEKDDLEQAAEEEDQQDGPPELRRRVLCPDGACIGVIGPDGKCKVCGAALDGDAGSDDRDSEVEDEVEDDEDDDEVEVDDEDDDEEDDEDTPAPRSSPKKLPPGQHGVHSSSESGGLDLASRELCPDGVCIGVIGPDGKCKVCGKSRTWKPAEDENEDAEDAEDA